VPGRLAVSLAAAGRLVEIRRDGSVPGTFWSKARAEWGTLGRNPARVLEIHTERFLARLDWLASACRRDGVAIDWDEHVPALIGAHRAERRNLQVAVEQDHRLSEDQLSARLDQSRYVRELRSFQRRDLAHLLSLAHGANFSVPGAGKTAVQLACFEAERAAGRVERMLVVAPISAFGAWTEEAAACLDPVPNIAVLAGSGIPLDVEIVLVNYQRLLYTYEAAARWVQEVPTLVCLDEAHRIKRGRSGEWGSTCLDLAYLAARRDVLTGTPAPQSPADLGVLLDYLWLGQGHRVLPTGTWEREPPPDIGHQIASAAGPLFVRTTKNELGLPPVDFEVIEVVPDQLQREVYNALRNRYGRDRRISRAQRAHFAHMGTIVMYLLEAATNPGLLTAGSSGDDPTYFRHPPLPLGPDSALADLLAGYGSHETPSKFLALVELLQGNREAGRKTLVWSNFVRNLEALRSLLEVFSPAVVHGGIPSLASATEADYTREGELERFRGDPDCWVLLANPAALGEGVSLHTACHDAIYLERTFNAGQYLQSLDRIHRLGLGPEVTTKVTFLITPETIDAVVADRVGEKSVLMGEMLDDPDILTLALPDEEDVGAPFDVTDRADVAALFAHLRPGDE
jgi:SNF2 family DNA or RNA helicase